MQLHEDKLLPDLVQKDADVDREMGDAIVLTTPSPTVYVIVAVISSSNMYQCTASMAIIIQHRHTGKQHSCVQSKLIIQYLSLTQDPPPSLDAAAQKRAASWVAEYKIDELFSETSFLEV